MKTLFLSIVPIARDTSGMRNPCQSSDVSLEDKSEFRIGGLFQLFFLMTLFWLCLLGPAHATVESTEQIGSVVAVRGDVLAKDTAGATRKLAIKDPIFIKDTLDTGKRGRIQVLFNDQTIVSLGRGTVMKISEYVWGRSKAKNKMKTEVKEGVFRVMGGLLTKTSPENFITETPSGNIGIRGSMYAGKVEGTTLSVMFEGGKGIFVKNATGIVEISRPGFGTSVAGPDKPFSKPFKFTSREVGNLNKTFETRPGRGPSGAKSSLQLPVTFTPGDMAKLHKEAPVIEDAPAAEAKPEEAAPEEKKTEEKEQEKEKAEEQLAKISDQVLANPEAAQAILREAVKNNEMNVEQALDAVLHGMRNPTEESFKQIVNEAIEMGITADDARDIVERLKASGGVCK